MSNPERVMMAVWTGTVILASVASLCAEEMTPVEPSPQQQSVEIRRKFSELSRKVNEQPEIKALKSEVEKAQLAYTAAFEAAMAKEDPEILAKYRSLFEARIQRLQGARQVAPESSVSRAGSAVSDGGGKKLADAQKKAMSAPTVQAALQKWNAAKTDGERDLAKTEYLEVLRQAMIEADPSLKSLLLEAGEQADAKPLASPVQ